MSHRIETDIIWNGNDAMRQFDVALHRSLTESAILVQGHAKTNAPVDTGFLRSSITRDVEKENASVGTDLEYAPYVEFGTKRQAAKPYLKPALITNISKILSIFKRNNIKVKYVD